MVILASAGSVIFETGGLHLMLIGLTGRLVEGQTYPLELHFEKTGIVKVLVTVNSIATRAYRAGPSLKVRGSHVQ
jgi:copper(I)-binding protein